MPDLESATIVVACRHSKDGVNALVTGMNRRHFARMIELVELTAVVTYGDRWAEAQETSTAT